MLVTRLELFLRSHGVAPSVLSKKTVHSRQHLLRLRVGESLAPRRCMLTLVAACEALTGGAVAPETLFESADTIVAGGARRLSDVHAPDLAGLDRAMATDRIPEAVGASGVATETAAAYLLRAARQRLDAQPAVAADIFGAALSMAWSLGAAAPELVAALGAEACKGRAETLRRLGRAQDGLDDLEMATALFTKARYCDGEAADVDYARAGALFGLGHQREGIVAAQDARGRYFAAGNARGAAHAEIAEACMHFDRGDTEAARKLFHGLRATLWKLRDGEALTRVWLNLALCEIGRGDGASARHWLVRAGAASSSGTLTSTRRCNDSAPRRRSEGS